jgi:hypothetical protein
MRVLWLAGAAAGAFCAYWMTRPAQFCVTSVSDADPEALLDLVSQVEREPEFVPSVTSVKVEERQGDSVRYRVETRIAGAPGWARFRKSIRPIEGVAEWETLEAAFGFRQTGILICERENQRTVTSVQTETACEIPALGPALARLSVPFLAPIFLKWVKNLEAAAESPAFTPTASAYG